MSRLIVTLSWDTWTKPPLMFLVHLQLSHLCWFMSVSCVSRGFSSSPQWGRMYPMGPQVLSKRKWKPLEWISGRSVTLNTDLKPMPFCPVISGDKVASHIQYILWWLPTMSLDLHILISFQGITYILTYVSIFVFALGAATHITDGPDVALLEASLIVKNGDAVSLHHKGQRWNDTSVWRVTVVISILTNGNKKIRSQSESDIFKIQLKIVKSFLDVYAYGILITLVKLQSLISNKCIVLQSY